MRTITIILALFSCLLLVACTEEVIQPQSTLAVQSESSGVSTTGQIHQVSINNFKFMPVNLEIKVGDTVEWVNKDYSSYLSETDEVDAYEKNGGTPEERDEQGQDEGIPHTVTFENGDIDEQLTPGATFAYTFTEKGEFRYFCKFHPEMLGTVIVN